MRRREFLGALSGAAAAWPLPARAQQGGVRRIGVLINVAENDAEMQASLTAFRQELGRLGWSEERNVRIDIRLSQANLDQLQGLAKEVVAQQPDVILAHTTPLIAATQRETRTIPIVFVNASDPIGSGFVASLARPGGNLTGLLLYEQSIMGKWLGMLKEIAPQITRAAFIGNSKVATYDYFLRAAEPFARSVARGRTGVEPRRNPRRYRTCHRTVLAHAQRRPILSAECYLHRESRSHHPARGPPSTPGGLCVPLFHGRGRSHVLRDRSG